MLETAETNRLARFIADASWGMFLNMLNYKAEETGCRIVNVDEKYPSTKTCSYCGYYNKDVTLSMRTITCPGCGRVYDRDGNAARNLYSMRGLNAETAGRRSQSSVDDRVVKSLGRHRHWSKALQT